jgi:hypothetical protein
MAATGVTSLIAVFDMPYDYYVLLRGLVSISAIFLGFYAVLREQWIWLSLAIPAFVLWFPLFGITLARESWAVLNLLAAVGFLLAWNKFEFSSKSTE